jgi:hypothetical protein
MFREYIVFRYARFAGAGRGAWLTNGSFLALALALATSLI